MKRLDLIINALDRVDTFDWNQQDNKLIKDALAAARSLRELEPVAWTDWDVIREEHGMWTDQRAIEKGWTPLYALGDEK